MGLSELNIELIKNKNIIFCPERKFQHNVRITAKTAKNPIERRFLVNYA